MRGRRKYLFKEHNIICMMCGNQLGCTVKPLCAAKLAYIDLIEEFETGLKMKSLAGMKKAIVGDYYETDKDIESLANKIIKRFESFNFIQDLDIKIAYLRSYEDKSKNGKAVIADCELVNKKMQAFLPYDFIITVYEAEYESLSDNQKKIVLYHELRHIGINDKGNLKVEPHHVEDFNNILTAFGIQWNSPIVDIDCDILENPEVLERDD